MTSSSSFAALDQFVAALEHRIQTAIAQLSPDAPPTIRCRFQQGRLLVLSEDNQTAVTATERDRRFKALALSMSQGLTETELLEEFLNSEGELPVRLYLRKRGTASPYAARSCGWKPADTVSDLFDPPTIGEPTETGSDETDVAPGALVLLSNPMEEETPPPFEEEIPETSTTVQQPLSQQWQQFISTLQIRAKWRRVTADWQELPWRSVGGLAIAGLTVGAIAYSVTRPCLVGSCERRQTASDLSQETFNQLQGNPTPEKVASAHDDVQKAVRLVSAIPPWSPHYDAAQAELVRYRTQLSDLEWIIAAQKDATTASEKSQDPPHPVPVWVEVHLLWQKAINHLNRVPDSSPLSEFAQLKLAEYEANREAIGQRLLVEEQAEANLNKAVQAAQLATIHTENAATLTDWLNAQREWDRATQALSLIPQGSLAHEEARSLRSDYRSKFIQTRTRTTFEKAGERAYQDALADAAQAQAAERRNQWTQAVNHWSDAYAQMRQVPKNTIRYGEAQGHLGSYQDSLKQAQTRLKQAVALQTIEDDLQNLCPIAAGICTYTYSSRQIEIILREPYDSAVSQSISPPSTQGRLSRSDSVIAETHQLVQSIMQLGNQIQLPISLYNVDRQFIARYRPEYGGFSRE
ncbi:hypothetical protein PN498_06245 [Oscillatoria sp. CS-180]|uniref:hypothetical protein n=1 Tax=Oscillatoria sp. CS-180 TaxID=3021720 RepID=UPI00232DA453|nr:hypothetical protein [Oscillatoria sp. CS-180]MDB9525581.1 hypothetical protein [Oscillatoria sp. CS-180]